MTDKFANIGGDQAESGGPSRAQGVYYFTREDFIHSPRVKFSDDSESKLYDTTTGSIVL